MLLSLYDEVASAPTREALLAGLLSFAEHLDFGRTGLLFVAVQPAGRTFTSIANLPRGYEEAFHALADQVRDPVMQRLRATNKPILWDQTNYTNAGAGDLWDIQAPFGYKTGAAVTIHLANGSQVILGIDRDSPLPRRDAAKARLLADVQLMAVHAQDAAVRLLQDPESSKLLTPRETEILGWIAAGKSNGVIAQLVGVSENTVEFHVKKIYRKLGCSNRHSAVIKADRLGLLAITPT